MRKTGKGKTGFSLFGFAQKIVVSFYFVVLCSALSKKQSFKRHYCALRRIWFGEFYFYCVGIPDFLVTRFRTLTATTDKLSDPDLTPLPTHPGIKNVARSQAPLLRSKATSSSGLHRTLFVCKSSDLFASHHFVVVQWS